MTFMGLFYFLFFNFIYNIRHASESPMKKKWDFRQKMVYFDLWADVCVPFLGRNNRSFAASGANINLLHRFNRYIALLFQRKKSLFFYFWPFPLFLSMKNCFQSFFFYLLLLFLYFQQVVDGRWSLDVWYGFWRLHKNIYWKPGFNKR